MLTARRYLLALTPEQEDYAELVASICGAVWNTGLEQRREYRRRGAFIGFVEQCRQLAEAKRDHPWLTEAPSHCLQQVLRDLDKACRQHGTFNLHWRSARKRPPSFRYPYAPHIHVSRLSRRWGCVRLPKLGNVRFRWSRAPGGEIRNATIIRDADRWYVSFCVEDGMTASVPNGNSPVGVDRGIAVAVATSDGWLRDREFITPGEARRLRLLHQQLNRCKRGSNRRKAVLAKLRRLRARERARRKDFCDWTANRLTRDHGLVVFEDLRTLNMSASASGTLAQPGKNVRAKAALNRAIRNKGWYQLASMTEFKARFNGSRVIKVDPRYTSQTCSACEHVAAESRESQARFRCVACGFQANADVNAAKNILAAGLAVTGRGDRSWSGKRQPPVTAA